MTDKAIEAEIRAAWRDIGDLANDPGQRPFGYFRDGYLAGHAITLHAAQLSDYMGVKKFLRGAKVSPIEEVKCRQAAAAIDALQAQVVEYIDFLEGEIGDSNSHWCANLELKQKVKELRAALGKDD